eukprot:sb/3466270/
MATQTMATTPSETTECWKTREGKLLAKLLPASETMRVAQMDELKFVLKTTRDQRIRSRAGQLYENMKLSMTSKLVVLYKKIDKDRPKIPLSEIEVLPDGSLIRHSEYNSGSTTNPNNVTLRTCVEGNCSSCDSGCEMGVGQSRDQQGRLSEMGVGQSQKQGSRGQQGRSSRDQSKPRGDKPDSHYILNVTMEEDKPDRKSSSQSTDSSYCDCTFCLQQQQEQEGCQEHDTGCQGGGMGARSSSYDNLMSEGQVITIPQQQHHGYHGYHSDTSYQGDHSNETTSSVNTDSNDSTTQILSGLNLLPSETPAQMGRDIGLMFQFNRDENHCAGKRKGDHYLPPAARARKQ